jgi:hypothetical protein
VAKIIFHLDSICPTGAGKVEGVKIEIEDEKLAGEAEVARERGMQSGKGRPAMIGIGREKAEKAHPPSLELWRTRWRDFTVLPGFSRCHLTGQTHGQENDWQGNGRKATKSLRIGEVHSRLIVCLLLEAENVMVGFTK